MPISLRRARIGQLVLGVQEGAGRGLNGDDARGLLHGLGRNVLVFEGEDVRTVDERANRVQVGGGTDSLVDGHLTGRPVLGLDEGPKVNAERDRALLHHACQLSAANDGNGGRSQHIAFHASQSTALLEAPRAASHGHERPFGHDAIGVQGRGDRGDGYRENGGNVGLEFEAPAHRLRQVVGEGQADARRTVSRHTLFEDVGG